MGTCRAAPARTFDSIFFTLCASPSPRANFLLAAWRGKLLYGCPAQRYRARLGRLGDHRFKSSSRPLRHQSRDKSTRAEALRVDELPPEPCSTCTGNRAYEHARFRGARSFTFFLF